MAHDESWRRAPSSFARRGRVLAFACSAPLLAACLEQDEPLVLPAASPGAAGASAGVEPPADVVNSVAQAPTTSLGAAGAPNPEASAGATGEPAHEGQAGGSSSAGAAGAGAEAPAARGEPPLLAAPVALADEALAREALALMGSDAVGASGSCAGCHALGRPTLTRWQQLTSAFASACLAEPGLAEPAAVDAMYGCFESHRRSDTGFSPADFGIYAAAAHLPWFSYVFEHARATAGAPAALQAFRTRVGMPRAGQPWTQAEFELVAEWFGRGLPGLFALVPEESGEGCEAELAPALLAHVDAMAAQGWRARNEQIPLLMYGCEAGQRGAACLGAFPAAASLDYGGGWDLLPGTTIRVLWDNSGAPTAYWSRSSPDGRFIASGLAAPDAAGYLGQILDLERGQVFPGDFAYDPTFFPDNSGFMVQRGQYAPALPGGLPTDGTPGEGDVALACEQSVLLGGAAVLTGEEPECTALQGQIGLYEQLAKSLDGDDYWVVFGSYGEDDGGFHPVFENPAAAFQAQSVSTLVPMINQGDGFEAAAPTAVATPLQGDPMLSPSGRLLVTRVKGAEQTVSVEGVDVVTAEQSGYALHLLTTSGGDGAWSASLEEVGRVCITGGKAVVSYDERWLVLHHYTTAADAAELGFSGADDPGFAPYAELGSSDIYLVDLRTGTQRRITNVSPGQYALFPHFRSDGWLYFVVRTLDGEEYFAASDAALVAEAE